MNFSTDVTKDLYNFPLEKADKPQVKINGFTLTTKKMLGLCGSYYNN